MFGEDEVTHFAAPESKMAGAFIVLPEKLVTVTYKIANDQLMTNN
jgi:hypothetical protein